MFLPGIHTQDIARVSGFDQKYKIQMTPQIFVLDKDKIIRYRRLSAGQIPEVLDFELAAKP